MTLDPDVEAKLRATMRERGVSFKVAINDAVRAGLAPDSQPSKRFRVKARPMGLRPEFNWDKALQIADEMEDEEIIRKMEMGK